MREITPGSDDEDTVARAPEEVTMSHRTTGSGLLAGLMFLSLVGCAVCVGSATRSEAAGSPGGSTAPAAATMTPTPAATVPTAGSVATNPATNPPSAGTAEAPAFHLVLMGDSVFNGVGYAASQLIGPKLGVAVTVAEWINPDLEKYEVGGERAPDLLARLRTDEALRADIRAAGAIWFDVPSGLMIDICGQANVSRTTVEACLPTVTSRYANDAHEIMSEIVALRPPTRAAIRVLTVWQFFLPTFRAAGTVDLAVQGWQQMRADVKQAARRHGIGVVDTYLAFSGSDGLRDAIGAGDVLSDEVHLTGQGVGRLTKLFVASGLAPSKE